MAGVAGRSGRPQGSKNRISAAAKQDLAAAFHGIGGRQELIRWGRQNRRDFYRIWARIIPSEVVAEIDLRDFRELSKGELYDVIASSEGSAGALSQGRSQGEPGVVHQISGPGLPASETPQTTD
jgi:hypothetical protein